jgi:hypothetical protein
MEPPVEMRDLSYRRRGKKFKSPVHDSQSQAERRTETPFSKSTENWELIYEFLQPFPGFIISENECERISGTEAARHLKWR